MKINLNLKVFFQEIISQKKEGACVIDLDRHKSNAMYWIASELNIFQKKLKN